MQLLKNQLNNSQNDCNKNIDYLNAKLIKVFKISGVNMDKGILIAIDGIDGSGKTTQAELLFKMFNKCGFPAIKTKEPTDEKWGKKLRESATKGRLPIEKEIVYFIKDRKQHIEEIIQPALNKGVIVILDRYYYSTIAYQGARLNDVEEIRKLIEGEAITPDIAFIMDADVEQCLHRIEVIRGDIPNHFERAEYQKEVRNVFLDLIEIEDELTKINAQNEIDIIYKQIISELINGVFKQRMCLKDYESDCYWCNHRKNKSCEWFKLAHCVEQDGVKIKY